MSATGLDFAAVRTAFERAAASYDAHAVVQQEVAGRLLERLDFFPLEPATVLDLGCGTGAPSHALQARWPRAQVIALDWAPAMLAQLRRRGPGPQAVCADLRALPLAPRSVDLLFSSLALQWVTDLEALFAEWRRVLRPGGLLLFSSFGPDTLKELRAAWAAVDAGPHVNRFPDMHLVGDLLLAGGWRDPVLDVQRIVLQYREPLTLMRDLKAIGAHNAATGRAHGLTGKGVLQRVLAACEAQRVDGLFPATWEVVIGAARGPEDGQPLRGPGGEIASFPVDALRGSRRDA